MKLTKINTAFFSFVFILSSYAIWIWDYWDVHPRNRIYNYYYIEGKDSIKNAFLKEIQGKTIINDTRLLFRKMPNMYISEKMRKKYNFNPSEFSELDSLYIDNRVFMFSCAFDNNKMLVKLVYWHYPSKHKKYSLYDGRRNQCADLYAEYLFRKDFLSKMGNVKKNYSDLLLHNYAEFFFWHQFVIYIIILAIWPVSKLIKWRNKENTHALRTAQRQF